MIVIEGVEVEKLAGKLRVASFGHEQAFSD
jgi:hypothetical protein